ncbi:hypothetical protein Tco_1558698, partial [Tanacetum coccineum]
MAGLHVLYNPSPSIGEGLVVGCSICNIFHNTFHPFFPSILSLTSQPTSHSCSWFDQKITSILQEEYDIWATEMEHYLEYIDNEFWKVIQNGNSNKIISTRKDGIVRILSPVTTAEIQAVEKERKAKNILLMAFPKEHMR